MPSIAAFCETPLQTRIARAIAETSADPARFVILLGDWSDNVGQGAAAEASGLAITRLVDPIPAAPMKARWLAVRDSVSRFLADGRQLLMFQDQHFFAQAVAAGARAANAPYDLVQDGYLDFDMNRIPAIKRALWPLARALDQRGPERPSARFRPWTNKELYLSHFFGHTRPDRIFTFGRSLGRRLEKQFGISQDRIIVSGPALSYKRPPDAPQQLLQPGNMKTLFFDQCFKRYRRMRPEGWRRDYLPVIETLSDFGADVKLHPAQTDDCVADIRAAMGDRGAILGREPAGASHLADIDIAVTVTSSSFLHCLELGIPVIFTNLPSSFDRMPAIKSPHLRNVATPDELRTVLESRQNGAFAANTEGAPLSDFIDYEAGGAELIARRIMAS